MFWKHPALGFTAKRRHVNQGLGIKLLGRENFPIRNKKLASKKLDIPL